MTVMAVAAALAAAGCGGDDEKERTADSGVESTAAQPTVSAPSATEDGGEPAPEDDSTEDEGAVSDTVETLVPQSSPGRGCLSGSYVSLSFVGKRSVDSPFGAVDLAGRGRGLGLDFAGARWTFRGVGSRPMRGTALGIKGTLKVNGSARGRLIRAPGKRLRFRQTGSRGTVTLAGLGQEFELPVSVVAPAVVPDGRAKVVCAGRRLTIDSASGVLRLVRP
jgi:hypothetical protein